MIEYRFYEINNNGRRIVSATANCEDDDAALMYARRLSYRRAVEIWADARKVAFIPEDGLMMSE